MGHSLPHKCIYCTANCAKKGLYKSVQKYYYRSCNKYQRHKYQYRITTGKDDDNIVQLNKEGMGISSISRYLCIAKTTVRRRILLISVKLQSPEPELSEINQVYEVDEMQTFIKRNHPSCYTYITYAINRVTKKVIDFVVGSRSKEVIGQIICKLLSLSPRRIYTDGLNIYPSLIPSSVHRVFRYHTNTIERNNLTLRTHIKRLNRKTICFSKSVAMLLACLKLYFWN
ncbi:MAG TPA: IS1 family transposase [Chitinophagaceae bacterium]|nr:IS1 family transposase [Chitinophagaceae bacterium]